MENKKTQTNSQGFHTSCGTPGLPSRARAWPSFYVYDTSDGCSLRVFLLFFSSFLFNDSGKQTWSPTNNIKDLDEADSIDIGGYISHRRTHYKAKTVTEGEVTTAKSTRGR